MGAPGFEGWAIIEILGHRRHVGRVSESSIAGAPMLRIDTPLAREGGDVSTVFYPPSSLFGLRPCSEEQALEALFPPVRPALPQPVTVDADTDEPPDSSPDSFPF